jgi:hypothetical protein
MSILDKYLVNSVYLFKIIPTSAFTDIPILSASSSNILEYSLSNLKDLVEVAERLLEDSFGGIFTQLLFLSIKCIVLG